MRKEIITVLLVCAYSAAMAGPKESGPRMYRYKNEAGFLVINDKIPPDLVDNGYEVLNDRGIVLERIPARMTDEEVAAKRLENNLKQKAAEDKRRRARLDRELLRRYSSVEDIMRVRDSRLNAIHHGLHILENNIRVLEGRLNASSKTDTPAEREEVRARLAETHHSLIAKQQELRNAEKQYAEEIERFEYLKAHSRR